MRGSNIVTEFFATAKKLGDGVCFHYKSGDTWNTLTWAEVADLVHQYARGLIAMGVTQGTPVAILSGTRMEWTMIDLAVLAVGGVVVPIYPNLPREHISYILKDSGAHLVVVENDAMLACLREAGDRAASYKVIILQIEGGGHYEGTTTLRSLIERGNEVQTHEIEARAAAVTLDMPASYIYTSGTTGVQKGVIVTHGNIYAVTEGTHDLIDFKSDEICMVCLPLAHVLGRMTQFYLLTKGCQSAYAESIEKLGQNYREVGPHFVVGVPRMLEKALERIESVIERTSPVARKLYYWAKRVAIEVGARREHGEKPRGMLALKYAVANKLVYSKLIDRMGGNLNTFVSGGAPLSFEIARFFTGLGVQVLEGYGLTETFAASTANRRNDFRFGTVGKPVKGVEIKLSGDGEVMIKGPTVFKGYLNKPEATDEAFEGEWFKTGDIGEFTRDGFLRITDRKKDIIVTAGGKNIAPQRIEAVIMESPYINHAMVYGDKRKYLTALVTLNPDAIKQFAQEEGLMFSRQEEMAENASVRELIDKVIVEQNKKLARFETIKRFAIVPTDFTPETGEITPTLKVRRKFVTKKYAEILDRLYED